MQLLHANDAQADIVLFQQSFHFSSPLKLGVERKHNFISSLVDLQTADHWLQLECVLTL